MFTRLVYAVFSVSDDSYHDEFSFGRVCCRITNKYLRL